MNHSVSQNRTTEAALAQQIFAQLDRPIWVVTSVAGTSRGGLVATWVTQASIDLSHPALMAGLAANHHTRDLVLASGAMAVHLLRPDQLDLVWRFALASGRTSDKLAGLEVVQACSGVPILADCLAWMDCRVITSFDGGDRTYILADVVAAARVSDGPIMRESHIFNSASAEQRGKLEANMNEDIEFARQARERFRAQIRDSSLQRP